MENKYKFEKMLPKFNNKTIQVLYRIWQFKIISRNNLANVCFFVDPISLNRILESLLNQKLIIVENNNSIKNMYSVTLLGSKKIFRHYSKPTFKYNNLNHDEKLYELIKINKWNFFLTTREIISIIGWDEFTKQNNRLPDLLVLEKVNDEWKYLAIELEITQKSKTRYENIFNIYTTYFYLNIYDKVVWYCQNGVDKTLNKALATIDPNNVFSKHIEIK